MVFLSQIYFKITTRGRLYDCLYFLKPEGAFNIYFTKGRNLAVYVSFMMNYLLDGAATFIF